MSLEVFGVPLKLNQHFSMAPNVFNVIFNNISAQRLPLINFERSLVVYKNKNKITPSFTSD